MLTCKTLRAAVEHPRSYVWRIRYKQKYDLPPGLDTPTIWKKYASKEALISFAEEQRYLCVFEGRFDQYIDALLDLVKGMLKAWDTKAC